MHRGFTLIELLIVIAILAVLAVAVVLVLNPAELLRQGRDSTRISDLAALNSAIALYVADGQTAWGVACNMASTSPAGWPGLCASPTVNTTTTVNSATGWVNLNLSLISSGSPLPRLPLDPINDLCTSNGNANQTCQYVYSASSSLGVYKLDAKLESSKYFATMQNDGGIANSGTTALYEVGSNLTLSP